MLGTCSLEFFYREVHQGIFTYFSDLVYLVSDCRGVTVGVQSEDSGLFIVCKFPHS